MKQTAYDKMLKANMRHIRIKQKKGERLTGVHRIPRGALVGGTVRLDYAQH